MVKTEVTNNVCIVGISTDINDKTNFNFIKSSLTVDGIFPVFMSVSSVIGSSDKIIVAIDSDDVFPLMNTLGKIRHNAGIRNYSINCSNSMIKWENKSIEDMDLVCDDKDDIKFIYIWDDKGICLCETSAVSRFCAKLG